MNKGGFSWKRAIGLSGAKSNISKKIGIPLTKSGRNQKIGRIVSGGGCLILLLGLILPVLFLAIIIVLY